MQKFDSIEDGGQLENGVSCSSTVLQQAWTHYVGNSPKLNINNSYQLLAFVVHMPGAAGASQERLSSSVLFHTM